MLAIEMLRDEKADVEDLFFKKIEQIEFHQVLRDTLNEDELRLIYALFYMEMTEREYAKKSKMKQQTIHYRKKRYLKIAENVKLCLKTAYYQMCLYKM